MISFKPDSSWEEDFEDIIKARITPSRGRVMRTEILDGALDFKKYYEQLGLNISGLVPNPRGDEHHVNHCWRFVRRCDSWLK